MIGRIALGSIMMANTACTPVPPAEEPIPVHGETGYKCNASAAERLVGRAASAELGAEALRLTGSRLLRWIRPGDVVTMEYREDRLNIELDAGGRVARLRCG